MQGLGFGIEIEAVGAVRRANLVGKRNLPIVEFVGSTARVGFAMDEDFLDERIVRAKLEIAAADSWVRLAIEAGMSGLDAGIGIRDRDVFPAQWILEHPRFALRERVARIEGRREQERAETGREREPGEHLNSMVSTLLFAAQDFKRASIEDPGARHPAREVGEQSGSDRDGE